MGFLFFAIALLLTPAVARAQADAWCTHSSAQRLFGDINGDGQPDWLCHDRSTGQKWVRLRSGSQLSDAWGNTSLRWCSHSGAVLLMGDVNGDRRSDLVCKDPGRIWVDYEQNFYGGTDFFVDTRWCSHRGASLGLADQNGDNREDLICIGGEGTFWVDYADTQGRFSGNGAGRRSPDFTLSVALRNAELLVEVRNGGAPGIVTGLTCRDDYNQVDLEEAFSLDANSSRDVIFPWNSSVYVTCGVSGKGIDNRPELIVSNNHGSVLY